MSRREILVKQHAERAAARVDAERYGFEPATIIAILTTVLPLIISCFRREEPDPAEVQAAVRKRCASESGKRKLRKRTMHRIRSQSDENLTKDQAFALADAVIAEALEADQDNVQSLCGLIGTDEHGDED